MKAPQSLLPTLALNITIEIAWRRYLSSSLTMDQALLMNHDIVFKQGYDRATPTLTLDVQSSTNIDLERYGYPVMSHHVNKADC